MNNTDFVRQAANAGQAYGTRISDILELELGANSYATPQQRDEAYAYYRDAGISAILALPTAPYFQADAMAAWREAATGVLVSRLKAMRNITPLNLPTWRLWPKSISLSPNWPPQF